MAGLVDERDSLDAIGNDNHSGASQDAWDSDKIISLDVVRQDRTLKKKFAANRIDVHVGQQIKSRRAGLGMSQEALAARAGISFQQVQKYEKGINRVSASRLYQFSIILEVPISYFFSGTLH